MWNKVFIWTSLCIGCWTLGKAQVAEDRIIERSIEIIAEINEDVEVDYTTLVDDLTAYLERPLELNTATREELQSLGFLTSIQVNAILAHRAEHGAFIGVEELQAIHILPYSVIQALRYFTQVGRDFNSLSIAPKEILENAEHELFLRTDRVIEEQKGSSFATDSALAASPNSRFLGEPWRYYLRYRFKYQNRISIGFTGESDAGEEFFKGSQKNGFDFYSAHAFVSGIGKVNKIALGDYHVQMGQGLTMWSGLSFGKSADLFSVKRNARGIRPYRSVDENNFLRGAAVSFQHHDFELSVFGSSKSRDGNTLTGDTLDPEQALSFSALQTSGFHRTTGELEDKNTIKEKLVGAELKWSNGGLNVGARGVYRELDKALIRGASDYGQFLASGKTASAIGLDYDYVRGNLNVFGEFARSQNGGLAMVNGAYLVLDPKLTFAMLHRSYERDFQGVYTAAIGENSTVANEKGLFMGIIARPADKWKFSAWMDRFQFPWLKFQVDAPAAGYEIMTQLNYKPNKKMEAYVRYRHRERPKNSSVEDLIIDQVSATEQNNFRIDFRYSIGDYVTMRSRIEATDYFREGDGTTRGILMLQDFQYKSKKVPVSFTFRYALFDTEDYDSRLYAYEHDVLYFYSIPAYNGVGSRYYLVSKYHINRNVDFWIKWARWHYLDRDVISSGLTEIDGNVRSDIRMQLRIKF